MNSREYFQQNYEKKSIESIYDYISFCTLETNRKLSNDIKLEYKPQKGIDTRADFDEMFAYYQDGKDFGKFKKISTKDFPIAYLKYDRFNPFVKKKIVNISDYNKDSGVLQLNTEANKYINKSLTYSFIIRGEFHLQSPYYSADDDHYYIIDNPVLKEKVFKVPMMRGSSWKGIIGNAVREVIKNNNNNLLEKYLSFVRLFGSGSDEFRVLIKNVKKEKSKEKFKKNLRFYALTKLGMKLNLQRDNIDDEIWKKIEEKFLQVQRGRLVFYPTYFDKLGLEMINPHKRRTKAGTQPVYYEVVPKGASGIFQLLYIPADGIAKSNKELQKEVQNDLDLLTAGLQRIFQENENDAQVKIGAKTKLGWGRVTADHLDLIKRKGDSLISPDSSFLKEYSPVNVVNATGREV